MHINFFKHVHSLEIKIKKLEAELSRVKSSSKHQIELLRNQLVLSKQGAPILDWAILKGYNYTDLSPTVAMEYYHNPNVIYQILDVSSQDHTPTHQFDQYCKIPLEEIEERYEELIGIKGMLLVISEEGLRSILACEKLAKHGIFNCFNVSGGYAYLPEQNSGEITDKDKLKKSA